MFRRLKMATSLVTGFVAPSLLVLVLYTTTILALECWGCLQTNRRIPYNYPRCDKPARVNSVSKEDILDAISVALLVRIASEDSEVKMTDGLFCMEVKSIDKSTGQVTLNRNIVMEAPSLLDQFGCYYTQNGRICFCQQNRCNDGIVDQGSRVQRWVERRQSKVKA